MTGCKPALFVLFIATALFASPVLSTVEWEWQGATSATSSATYPGARYGAQTWTDASGTLWMFSGVGKEGSSTEGYLNSLFKYTPSSNKWTSVSGSFSKNVAGTQSFPGGRYGAAEWTDKDGNLWMFGGMGIASDAAVEGLLNEMWQYSPSTGAWTLISGTSVNAPVARAGASTWVDADGYLYLCSGKTQTGAVADLWYFNPSKATWTVVVAPVAPSARSSAASWTDSNGNGWVYGGIDASGRLLSDLWQFNVADNTWYLKSGTTTVNQVPTYPSHTGGVGMPGGLYHASSWAQGNTLYLFGGKALTKNGQQTVTRNLWSFNTLTLTWTFVYGTPGKVIGSTIDLGARDSAAAWVTASGDLVVFGGNGFDTLGAATSDIIGDTWFMKACFLAGTCGNGKRSALEVEAVATTTTTSATSTTKAGTTSTAATTGTATTTANQTTGLTSSTGKTSTSGTTSGKATTTGASCTGTTNATVTVTLNCTGNATSASGLSSAVISGAAATFKIPSSDVAYSVVNGTGGKFEIVIALTFPNSAAIAAALNTTATCNMTSSAAALGAVVSAFANSTTIKAELSLVGISVTSVSVSVSINFEQGESTSTSTTSTRSAASVLPPTPILFSILLVLIASLLFN